MLFHHFETKNYILVFGAPKTVSSLNSTKLNETNTNPKIAKSFAISTFDNNHFWNFTHQPFPLLIRLEPSFSFRKLFPDRTFDDNRHRHSLNPCKHCLACIKKETKATTSKLPSSTAPLFSMFPLSWETFLKAILKYSSCSSVVHKTWGIEITYKI